MPKFLIIEPDQSKEQKSGRGARGRNLELFLQEYYRKSAASTISLKELSGSNSYKVDHLFIGIPSQISRKELNRVSCRKVHLFDYGDHEKVIWKNTDKELLSSVARSYLKTWTQKNWGNEFNWGTLPIRRHKRLYYCARWSNFLTKDSFNKMERNFDTTFLGNPMVGWTEDYGDERRITRIKWLEEISSEKRFSFSGGFFKREINSELINKSSNELFKQLFLKKGRINFISYYNLMQNAQTALTPPGNALWSYRHYEAIYAGALPISADFRAAKMLTPLPKDGMIHVGKGESVLPHLEEALRVRRDNPELPNQNLQSIEKYMSYGLYDRKKTLLLERFMKQIEKD